MAFQEQRTAKTSLTCLRRLGLEIQSGIAATYGLMATLDTGRPGPTLLIRADMDALPLGAAALARIAMNYVQRGG